MKKAKKRAKKNIVADKPQEWLHIGTIDRTSGTQTWAMDIPGCGCLVRVTQVMGRVLGTTMVYAPNVNVVKDEGEGGGINRLVCLRPFDTYITVTSDTDTSTDKWTHKVLETKKPKGKSTGKT